MLMLLRDEISSLSNRVARCFIGVVVEFAEFVIDMGLNVRSVNGGKLKVMCNLVVGKV